MIEQVPESREKSGKKWTLKHEHLSNYMQKKMFSIIENKNNFKGP